MLLRAVQLLLRRVLTPCNRVRLFLQQADQSNIQTSLRQDTLLAVNFVTHDAASGSAESVYAVVLDDDGDIDLLVAFRPNKFAWYENTDGELDSGSCSRLSVLDPDNLLRISIRALF